MTILAVAGKFGSTAGPFALEANACLSQLARNRSRLWPNDHMVLYSNTLLIADIVIGLTLLVGPMHSTSRWHSNATIRFRVTIRGLLAIIATTAACIAIFLHGHDWLWTIKPIATGVLVVGIFLTCFAVIDWIGGLWSLATRRFFARSAQAD